jgi:hypothetical protein
MRKRREGTAEGDEVAERKEKVNTWIAQTGADRRVKRKAWG